MALSYSPGLQNFIATQGSWKRALDGGHILIYTGTKPATADLAVTGTLLATITSGGATKTNEVKPLGVVTLSVGAAESDTVTTFAINSLEIMGSTTAFGTSLTATAAAIALKINRNPRNLLFVASSSGAVITITGKPGLGALYNAKALAVGVGGNMIATVDSTSFGSGTGGGTAGVYAVNGLQLDYNATAGVVTKDATQTWSGTAVATGTAGWFRYVGSIADAGALDSSAVYLRMDGTIASSGGDMTMSSTSIVSGATQTLSTFSFTVPAA